MTLYRKYRPQKIEELDLIDIRDRLSKVLSSGRVPHAFLFAGPKGTGKTSAARIIAKILNCEKRNKEIEPCNKCESCVSITDGRNMDVMEIDAASNRGIEEIRDLREKIRLAPTSSRFKVYIIDEVHMLTTEAFNALLKTLEEPPAHAIFILATTEADKLLPTIISRCSRFDFKKASTPEIMHSLKRVSKGEKISIDEAVLEKIASVSDGSFRDATKILEQAISEDALTAEKINTILGEVNAEGVDNFLNFIFQRKAKESLEYLEEINNKGMNMRTFTASLLRRLHDILLEKHGLGDGRGKFEIANVNDINNSIKLFSRVYAEYKTAAIPELPMEIAVVEWCESG
ncbi:DNA polymerase III, subunit gamma and tau [Candidatus Gottesmanbacteria bacterium RIFCSPHIGHO2_01_FULL_39_10]|uniref:DNA polymerase III subunit gamma/tau n=1 Tax=Candidatus Gottesmanbacteria bacterium RIFCSPHIGHO2_01_FULL_39_10 TaxID=1798375 RepID=A0A1F5ZQI2_9BACT|nr:MAG: DNA polymerase III, subunit gamma and tau [Candidatus Gottesmanbacteria bacterium RIFCSPHIGHO2_01_FULL_39_10]